MDKPLICISTPQDFIAYAQHSSAIPLKEKLICLTMEGAMLVSEIPDSPNPVELAKVLSGVIRAMATVVPKPSGVHLALFSDLDCDACEEEGEVCMPVLPLLTLMARSFEAIGLDVGFVVAAKKDQYSVFPEEEWHSLSDVDSSLVKVQLVAAGSAPAVGFTVPEASLATASKSMKIDNLNASIPKLEIEDLFTSPHVAEARELWERCLTRGFGPSEPEAMRLVAYFQREEMSIRLCADVVDTSNDPSVLMLTTLGRNEKRLSMRRVESAQSLLMNLMQWTDDAHRPRLLHALAWVNWTRGDSLVAIQCLEEAAKLDEKWGKCVLSTLIKGGGYNVAAMIEPTD